MDETDAKKKKEENVRVFMLRATMVLVSQER